MFYVWPEREGVGLLSNWMLVEMILVSSLTMSPRIWFIECIIQVLFLDIDDSHSASQVHVPQCKWEK